VIFWTGNGWLVLAIFLVSALAPNWIANGMHEGYAQNHSWPSGLGVLLGAFLLYRVGRSLNEGRPRPERGSGGPFQSRPDHSFMFIRMEWWAPVLAIVGVAFLFS
jgi:hypothetical protein